MLWLIAKYGTLRVLRSAWARKNKYAHDDGLNVGLGGGNKKYANNTEYACVHISFHSHTRADTNTHTRTHTKTLFITRRDSPSVRVRIIYGLGSRAPRHLITGFRNGFRGDARAAPSPRCGFRSQKVPALLWMCLLRCVRCLREMHATSLGLLWWY